MPAKKKPVKHGFKDIGPEPPYTCECGSEFDHLHAAGRHLDETAGEHFEAVDSESK